LRDIHENELLFGFLSNEGVKFAKKYGKDCVQTWG
jgi:hypothetical protein